MNMKGKKGTIQKIVEISLVTLVVLFIMVWFFGATGIGTKMVKKAGDFFIEHMPLAQGEKYSKESDMAKSFGGLVNSFALAASSNDEKCFVKLGELPNEYQGYTLSFKQEGADFVAEMIYLDSNTPVHREVIQGLNLCYVGGEGLATQRFYNNYLAEPPIITEIKDYANPNKVEFIKKEGFWGFAKKDGMYIDGIEYGYAIPYLYKAGANEICFIPSSDNTDCIGSSDAISDGCVANLDLVYEKKKCTRNQK